MNQLEATKSSDDPHPSTSLVTQCVLKKRTFKAHSQTVKTISQNEKLKVLMGVNKSTEDLVNGYYKLFLSWMWLYCWSACCLCHWCIPCLEVICPVTSLGQRQGVQVSQNDRDSPTCYYKVCALNLMEFDHRRIFLSFT